MLKRLTAYLSGFLAVSTSLAQPGPGPVRLERELYEAGAVLLHDGRGLEAEWDAPGRNWAGAGSDLVRTGPGGDAWYRRHRLAGEFDLTFEYQGDLGASGGFGVLRSQRVLPIGLTAPGADPACKPAPVTLGLWHRAHIRSVAGMVEMSVDGTALCSIAAADAAPGDAALFFPRLLDGEGTLRFRSLIAKPIPASGLFRPSPLAGLAQKIAIADGLARYVGALPATFGYTDGGKLPGMAAPGPLKLELMGEDSAAKYFSYSTPALVGLDATGMILVPNGVQGPLPVMIAIHGSGGSPELALQAHHVYHDMLRGPVRAGYLVIAPQLVTANRRERPYGNTIDPDVIDGLEKQFEARHMSILAIEGARAFAALTAVMGNFAIDPKRIGVTGLSYGGFMATWLTAYEPRVVAGVSAAGFSPFVSPEIVPAPLESLRVMAPKPFAIMAGEFDPFHDLNAGWAQEYLPMVEAAYGAEKKGGRFEFIADFAGHDYSWEPAKRFFDKAFGMAK